jgi:hypothetical protein
MTPMSVSVHCLSVELFTHGLTSLAAILRKAKAHAEEHKLDAGVLESWRLTPDMLNFTRQVHLACDFAKNSSARLAGVEAPVYPDVEKTLDELAARVEKTLEFLRGITHDALEGAEDRDIKLPLRTRTLEMRGLAFLQRWAIPNFYFHLTTAYDLLRQAGVAVGKQDYLGGV